MVCAICGHTPVMTRVPPNIKVLDPGLCRIKFKQDFSRFPPLTSLPTPNRRP